MVPRLFWHEMRNLLLWAERRGRIETRHVDKSMARLRPLRIRCTDDTDDRDVMELARGYRLTVYDSSYLARASLDRRLNEAAAAEGVSPFA